MITDVAVAEILDQQTTFTAKSSVPVKAVYDVYKWLTNNCGRRWDITDHRGNIFNWRKMSKLTNWEQQYIGDLHMTVLITFVQQSDLMSYMSVWPSELLLSESDSAILV